MFMEDEHISQSHNKGLLLYHLVFEVESSLRDVCIGISQRYEVNFVEIGVDEDHDHFLIQSVPMLSITQIVKLLKNLIARQLFQLHPEIKKQLGGGNLWSKTQLDCMPVKRLYND